MELTLSQEDALTELINIGYGRAAGALSELTGYRIQLEVPRVAMHAFEDLSSQLPEVGHGDVASVTQGFSGPIAGNALLLLDEPSALSLSQLLMGEQAAPAEFNDTAREVITEVGNILLNACLGVFGNLLQVPVSFAVPRLHMESLIGVLGSIASESTEKIQHALVIQTRFHVRESNVNGCLVIILGITSLDRMLFELARWEKRQMT